MRTKLITAGDLDLMLQAFGRGSSIESACRRANVDLKSFNALRVKRPDIRKLVNTTRVAGLRQRAVWTRQRADGYEYRALKLEREGDQLHE